MWWASRDGASAFRGITEDILASTPASTRKVASLTLTAIGVVYGDIGTSPLYALRECFFGSHSVPATQENVLGVLS